MRKLLLWVTGRKIIPHQRIYRYKYQRYPWDDGQQFTVLATAQNIADRLAQDRFAELVSAGMTTMREFYAVR